jgi:hypothetical protein
MKTTATCKNYFADGDGEAKIEVGLLRNVSNRFAFEVMAMLAMHNNVALVVYETSKCFEHGGFTRTIWTNDCNKFACANCEGRRRQSLRVVIRHRKVNGLQDDASVCHLQPNPAATLAIFDFMMVM